MHSLLPFSLEELTGYALASQSSWSDFGIRLTKRYFGKPFKKINFHLGVASRDNAIFIADTVTIDCIYFTKITKVFTNVLKLISIVLCTSTSKIIQLNSEICPRQHLPQSSISKFFYDILMKLEFLRMISTMKRRLKEWSMKNLRAASIKRVSKVKCDDYEGSR